MKYSAEFEITGHALSQVPRRRLLEDIILALSKKVPEETLVAMLNYRVCEPRGDDPLHPEDLMLYEAAIRVCSVRAEIEIPNTLI